MSLQEKPVQQTNTTCTTTEFPKESEDTDFAFFAVKPKQGKANMSIATVVEVAQAISESKDKVFIPEQMFNDRGVLVYNTAGYCVVIHIDGETMPHPVYDRDCFDQEAYFDAYITRNNRILKINPIQAAQLLHIRAVDFLPDTPESFDLAQSIVLDVVLATNAAQRAMCYHELSIPCEVTVTH